MLWFRSSIYGGLAALTAAAVLTTSASTARADVVSSTLATATSTTSTTATPTLPPTSVTVPVPGNPVTVTVALPSTGTAGASSAPAPGSPSGSGSASGVSVPPASTCLSCTSASSGPGGSSSSATAVQVAGTPVSGGTANGNGSSQGAIVAVDGGPQLSAAVADWFAFANSGANSGSSASRTAIADLSVGGHQLDVAVLESDSQAQSAWDAQGSHSSGHAESNGATVNAGQGQLVVILLHSESGSQGSDAYLASINGNVIGDSKTAGQSITIPGVGTINLLDVQSAGGATSNGAVASTGSAAVATVTDALGQQGQLISIIGAGSSSAGMPAGSVAGIDTGSSTGPSGAGVVAGVTTPDTGAALLRGALLLLLGAVLLLAARLRTRRAS